MNRIILLIKENMAKYNMKNVISGLFLLAVVVAVTYAALISNRIAIDPSAPKKDPPVDIPVVVKDIPCPTEISRPRTIDDILEPVITENLELPHKIETDYSKEIAKLLNGQTEYVLWEDSRVDVMTDTEAIECEFPKKWQEAIGQSLYYSINTSRKPTIILLIKDLETEKHFVYRCEITAFSVGIEVWLYDVNKGKFLSGPHK